MSVVTSSLFDIKFFVSHGVQLAIQFDKDQTMNFEYKLSGQIISVRLKKSDVITNLKTARVEDESAVISPVVQPKDTASGNCTGKNKNRGSFVLLPLNNIDKE